MGEKVQNINEYRYLFGNRLPKGNPFEYFINEQFIDKKSDESFLIFSILENVNLDKNLSGIGDTHFFTNNEDDKQNEKIKDEYKSIIETIRSEYSKSIAEYEEWYKSDTIFIARENSTDTVKFNLDNSKWRQESYFKKKIENNSFIRYEGNDNQFETLIENYFTRYLELLEERLQFDKFPFYVVIAKPITIKNKNDKIKLGNIYLHFATTIYKDAEFYKRLLNDYLLVWINETGAVIFEEIKQNVLDGLNKTINECRLEFPYLPTFWATKGVHKLTRSNARDIDDIYTKNNKSIRDLYLNIFNQSENKYINKLHVNEQYIVDNFIPRILKEHPNFKDEVAKKTSFIDIFKEIFEGVDKDLFNQDDHNDTLKFISLLSQRHIVNICFCIFGMNSEDIYNLFFDKSLSISSMVKVESKNLNSRFSPLFYYNPDGGVSKLNGNIVFKSISIYEEEYLKKCSEEIGYLLSEKKQLEIYNKLAIKELKINEIVEDNE